MPIQTPYPPHRMFAGKRALLLTLFLSACFTGLWAQSDAGKRKLELSLHANFGAVVTLPKETNSDVIYVPATLSQYFGVLINGQYGNFCLETGLQRYTFPVTMAMRDTAIQSGVIASFNNPYTAYPRIPFSLGYDIALRNRHFSFEPYLTGGLRYKSSPYSHLSSPGGIGLRFWDGDTITTSFSYGNERTQRSIFDAGLGAKLKFRYKAFTAHLNVQYFQTLGAWGTLYGVYERHSPVHGALYARESVRSPDRNFIIGITAGMYLLK